MQARSQLNDAVVRQQQQTPDASALHFIGVKSASSQNTVRAPLVDITISLQEVGELDLVDPQASIGHRCSARGTSSSIRWNGRFGQRLCGNSLRVYGPALSRRTDLHFLPVLLWMGPFDAL
ncbi:hypothetical protein QYL93_28745, partial [Acidovorax sp. A1169]|nr:hypothetical protein [Acidovorax sp. A1169]